MITDLNSKWKTDTLDRRRLVRLRLDGQMQMRLNFDGWMGIAPVNGEYFCVA